MLAASGPTRHTITGIGGRRSGHGVCPSVITTTACGRGRTATAASIPAAGVEIVQMWFAEFDTFAQQLRLRRDPLGDADKLDLSVGQDEVEGSSEPVALGQVSLDELESLVDDAQVR